MKDTQEHNSIAGIITPHFDHVRALDHQDEQAEDQRSGCEALEMAR